MKIEKISENQIKFILNCSDLEERDIHMKELAYGSEKAQALFHEMMEEAFLQFDFQAENTPLMIEALPIAGGSIMIIVTKISTSEDIESRLNGLFSQNSDILKHKEHLIAESHEEEESGKYPMLIFSFDTLDEVSAASVRLLDIFVGSSSLYKNQNRYFLLMEDACLSESAMLFHTTALLSEYGRKHQASDFSRQYFEEHAERIIESSAIGIMANL